MSIVKQFEKMGARAIVSELPERWNQPVRINILSDKKGEYFDIQVKEGVEVQVVDCRPEIKHLLLMSKDGNVTRGPAIKDKFLCGHDERHWFVAASPGAPATVERAMDLLKPAAVANLDRKVRKKDKNRRHNKARKRQGEWFFVPVEGFSPDPKKILFNEPLRRGRGKPHMCEMLFRKGGETVYVSFAYPNGVTQLEWERLLKEDYNKKMHWQVMRRDPVAYVKGRVSHSDHATLVLDGWHRVYMNEENKSRSMRNVAFLD